MARRIYAMEEYPCDIELSTGERWRVYVDDNGTIDAIESRGRLIPNAETVKRLQTAYDTIMDDAEIGE